MRLGEALSLIACAASTSLLIASSVLTTSAVLAESQEPGSVEKGLLQPSPLQIGMTSAETARALGMSEQDLMPSGAPARPGGRDAVPVHVIVATPSPAQLTFCSGVLSGWSELVPGGIREFLQRSEGETRERGLVLPQLVSQPDGSELVYSAWRDGLGGTVTLGWNATSEGGVGIFIVRRPCQADTADSPVAENVGAEGKS